VSARQEVPLTAAVLVGRTIVAADINLDSPGDETGYLVLRLDDGSTLYADEPVLYAEERIA
jgi:hypothetical protein